MKQNLYVLAALGVVMNSQAMKQSKNYHDFVNIQVFDEDDDDEPVNLNVDMNQMVKDMSVNHVDLIVSDFDGGSHHHHHKNKQEQSNDEQSVQVVSATKDFDSDVLNEYTSRSAGHNSNAETKTDYQFQSRMKAAEAEKSEQDKAINSNLKIAAPEPVKIHSGQDILTPFEDEAPAAPAPKTISKAQKVIIAPKEAPSTASAYEAEAVAAEAAANVEVEAAKEELRKLTSKQETSKKSKKGKSTKAMEKIMAIGEAMTKNLDKDSEEKEAPVAVPIGTKLKQTKKTQAPVPQSAAITPGEPVYEESKAATSVSDIANEIIADGEAEGLNTNSIKPVLQQVQSHAQITEDQNLQNYRQAMSNRSVEVDKNVEDGAGEDNVMTTNEKILQNIFSREERKSQLAQAENERKQREASAVLNQQLAEQKRQAAQAEARKHQTLVQSKLIWPEDIPQEYEYEDFDMHMDF